MAKIKMKELMALHGRMGEVLSEYQTNKAAEAAAAGEDNELGIGPETSVQGNANDSAARGGKSMAEGFKNFNRIPNKM